MTQSNLTDHDPIACRFKAKSDHFGQMYGTPAPTTLQVHTVCEAYEHDEHCPQWNYATIEEMDLDGLIRAELDNLGSVT
ncbi:hypothetical protein LCGC14_2900820 [marine sediment metagenome]|uniref:Uncharacterized protein n=1 Tax=marine sediment metagenome TaxID=412755 RepID=A0A0F9A2B3_9ZZZZ